MSIKNGLKKLATEFEDVKFPFIAGGSTNALDFRLLKNRMAGKEQELSFSFGRMLVCTGQASKLKTKSNHLYIKQQANEGEMCHCTIKLVWKWIKMYNIMAEIVGLTFQDFSHGHETGDTMGNFAWDDRKVVLDFEVGRWIGSWQNVQNKLQQFAILQGRLAAGLQRFGSNVVRLRRISGALKKWM